MVMGGAMIIAGQESDPRPLAARESIGVFGGDCFEMDPNHALIGAGGAAVRIVEHNDAFAQRWTAVMISPIPAGVDARRPRGRRGIHLR